MRKIIRKLITPIILIFGGVVLFGSLAVLIVLLIKTKRVGYDSFKAYWEMWYYAFCIVGAVGTVSAVVVALYKDEISAFFHAPDLSIKEGELQVVAVRKVSGALDHYKAELQIENNGNEDARKCNLILNKFSFDKNRLSDKRKTEYSIPSDCKQVIGDEGGTILSESRSTITLFKIINPSNTQTPEGGAIGKPLLDFEAHKFPDDIVSEGNYEIYCEVRASNAKMIKFKVSIEWPGRWDEDEAKMSESINIKIEKI